MINKIGETEVTNLTKSAKNFSLILIVICMMHLSVKWFKLIDHFTVLMLTFSSHAKGYGISNLQIVNT